MRRGICLGLKQWIVYWDFETWKSRIILDVEDSEAIPGYGDRGKYILGLSSDPLTDAMWLNLGVIYRVEKTSRSVSTAADPKTFYRRELAGSWEEIEKENLPPPSEVDQKLDQARQLLKDAKVSDIREVAVWRDKIIVLYGSGSDTWKVSEFSPVENGGENEK